MSSRSRRRCARRGAGAGMQAARRRSNRLGGVACTDGAGRQRQRPRVCSRSRWSAAAPTTWTRATGRAEELTGDASGSVDLDEVEAGQRISLRVEVAQVLPADSATASAADRPNAPTARGPDTAHHAPITASRPADVSLFGNGNDLREPERCGAGAIAGSWSETGVFPEPSPTSCTGHEAALPRASAGGRHAAEAREQNRWLTRNSRRGRRDHRSSDPYRHRHR